MKKQVCVCAASTSLGCAKSSAEMRRSMKITRNSVKQGVMDLCPLIVMAFVIIMVTILRFYFFAPDVFRLALKQIGV